MWQTSDCLAFETEQICSEKMTRKASWTHRNLDDTNVATNTNHWQERAAHDTCKKRAE